MASSVPLVRMKSSGSTPKNAASSCLIFAVFGINARPGRAQMLAKIFDHLGRRAHGVLVEIQPQLARRVRRWAANTAPSSAPPRAAAKRPEADRFVCLLAKPHLHRSGVRFQPFGARQRGDGRRQLAAKPSDVSSCTEITFTKSADDSPPRIRAAPKWAST
jgi:hypothetical protein